MKSFILSLIILITSYVSTAQASIGKVLLVRGTVRKKLNNSDKVQFVKKGEVVFNRTTYKTSAKSILKIRLEDGSQILLSPNSKTIITHFPKEKVNIVNVLSGKLRAYVKKKIQKDGKHKFVARAKGVALGVRGTEFLMAVAANSKNVLALTFEGSVSFVKYNKRGLVNLLDSLSKGITVLPGQRSIYNPLSQAISAPVRIPQKLFLKLANKNPFGLATNYLDEFSLTEESEGDAEQSNKDKKKKKKKDNEKKEKNDKDKDNKEDNKESAKKKKEKQWFFKLALALFEKSYDFNQKESEIRDRFDGGPSIGVSFSIARKFGKFLDVNIAAGVDLINYDPPNNVQSSEISTSSFGFFSMGVAVNLSKSFSLLIDRVSQDELAIGFTREDSSTVNFFPISVNSLMYGVRMKTFTLFNKPVFLQGQLMKLSGVGNEKSKEVQLEEGSGYKVGLTQLGALSTEGFHFSLFYQKEEHNSQEFEVRREKLSLEMAYIF